MTTVAAAGSPLGILSPTVRELLCCPMCHGPLSSRETAAECQACGAVYPLSDAAQIDLRLRGPKTVSIDFTIGDEDVVPQAHAKIDLLRPNPSPQIPEYQSIPIPSLLRYGNRLTRTLLSYFPRPPGGGVMLDLGCGYEDFKPLCAHTGLEYVGIDYDGPAKILADAHALPFKDNSFDFVMSFAVLEHLRYPFAALREVRRVLKPGAPFVGTVAFLESFHLNSFYHPSPLGTYDLLAGSGFEIIGIEPNANWQCLRAQGWMGLFPHAPQVLSDLLILPLHLLHRAWWKLGGMVDRREATSERARLITNTAGFRFVCRKPAG